jgi:ribosomal protein L29
MKKKEITNMHANSPVELAKIVKDTESKLADLKVNRYSKQSKNVREAREMRNKIAVAKTILRYKELQNE